MLYVETADWGRLPVMARIPGDVPGFTSPSNATMVAPRRLSVAVPWRIAPSACVTVPFRASGPPTDIVPWLSMLPVIRLSTPATV